MCVLVLYCAVTRAVPLHHFFPDKAPVVKALLVWTSANSFMYRILANRVSYPVSNIGLV